MQHRAPEDGQTDRPGQSPPSTSGTPLPVTGTHSRVPAPLGTTSPLKKPPKWPKSPETAPPWGSPVGPHPGQSPLWGRAGAKGSRVLGAGCWAQGAPGTGSRVRRWRGGWRGGAGDARTPGFVGGGDGGGEARATPAGGVLPGKCPQDGGQGPGRGPVGEGEGLGGGRHPRVPGRGNVPAPSTRLSVSPGPCSSSSSSSS